MGELQYSPEDAYLKFESTIAAVNALIEQYQPVGVDFQVDPRNGSVGFASGLHGWGFTLPQLAERMLQRQGQSAPSQAAVLKLSKRLWGSYYVDAATNKWKKDYFVNDDGEAQERVFCKFALQPIYDVFDAEKEGCTKVLLWTSGATCYSCAECLCFCRRCSLLPASGICCSSRPRPKTRLPRSCANSYCDDGCQWLMPYST